MGVPLLVGEVLFYDLVEGLVYTTDLGFFSLIDIYALRFDLFDVPHFLYITFLCLKKIIFVSYLV